MKAVRETLIGTRVPDLNSDTQIEIEVDWEAAKLQRGGIGKQSLSRSKSKKKNLLVFLNAQKSVSY